MQKTLLATFLVAVTMISAGCAGMARTNWSNPGTAALQRKRAEQFDPYPQAFCDSNETVGTRPRDYDRPTPNPEPMVPRPWSRTIPVTNTVPAVSPGY